MTASPFLGCAVRVKRSLYDIDDQIIGRMLCVVVKQLKRGKREHQFVFAGYQFDWEIHDRELVVWVLKDVLHQI